MQAAECSATAYTPRKSSFESRYPRDIVYQGLRAEPPPGATSLFVLGSTGYGTVGVVVYGMGLSSAVPAGCVTSTALNSQSLSGQRCCPVICRDKNPPALGSSQPASRAGLTTRVPALRRKSCSSSQVSSSKTVSRALGSQLSPRKPVQLLNKSLRMCSLINLPKVPPFSFPFLLLIFFSI